MIIIIIFYDAYQLISYYKIFQSRSTVDRLIDLLKKADNHHAYFAGEYQTSDGPFESPQDFRRLNLMGKYVVNLKNNDANSDKIYLLLTKLFESIMPSCRYTILLRHHS